MHHLLLSVHNQYPSDTSIGVATIIILAELARLDQFEDERLIELNQFVTERSKVDTLVDVIARIGLNLGARSLSVNSQACAALANEVAMSKRAQVIPSVQPDRDKVIKRSVEVYLKFFEILSLRDPMSESDASNLSSCAVAMTTMLNHVHPMKRTATKFEQHSFDRKLIIEAQTRVLEVVHNIATAHYGQDRHLCRAIIDNAASVAHDAEHRFIVLNDDHGRVLARKVLRELYAVHPSSKLLEETARRLNL